MKYREELNFLFEEYSDEEVNALFALLMRLYSGIENLENNI